MKGLGPSARPWMRITLAWLNLFRRLTIRYERRADIDEAFVILGCALICLNQFSRFGQRTLELA